MENKGMGGCPSGVSAMSLFLLNSKIPVLYQKIC